MNICQKSISDMKACFFNFMTWVQKVSFLIVLDFCDQVLAMLNDESCTGKKNLALPLEVVREFCTAIFYIVVSEEF